MTKATKVLKANVDHVVQLVTKELQVNKELKEKKVEQVIQEVKEKQVHKDHKENLETKD